MNAKILLASCWRPIVVVIALIALSTTFFISFESARETKWLFVVLIMAIFWVTEAIPYSITSLLPIGLFPLLGILDTATICKMYAHETVFTFLGMLIIASSVEACNLHKRIALKILCNVKCFHRRLHFVVMTVTMLTSMWMQNFVVVTMMSEVCLTILEQLEAQGTTTLYKRKAPEGEAGALLRPTNITKCYMLGIAYAATLGGCGSLFGTSSNLAFKGIVETYFASDPDPNSDTKLYSNPNSDPEIGYLEFFLYSAPIMLVNTLLTWLWLQLLFMGLLRPKSDDTAALLVNEEDAKAVKENIILNYESMGRLKATEIQVALLLVVFHLVLAFRPFWAALLPQSTNSEFAIRDASPTIVFVILLFIMPSQWNCFKFCRKSSNDNNHQDKSQPLLAWTFVRRKVPWGLIFLLGAGIALANSAKELKIHEMETMKQLTGQDIPLPIMAISFIVCLVCQIFTEFSSNAVTANILLPLLATFCKNNGFDYIGLMFPAAFSINMAFHSTIGTPGNAYVAGLVDISAKQMLYCGIGPSIFTLLTYWSTFPTYGTYIYGQLYTSTESTTSNTK